MGVEFTHLGRKSISWYMKGNSCFVCAKPLAQLCQAVGTTMPTRWHKRANRVAQTWHSINEFKAYLVI